jgi:hypothetical protein
MKYNQLKIITLSIWWGTFTFYAGIVVTVGMQVLGSHIAMGFITQQVTVYLNIFSLIIFQQFPLWDFQVICTLKSSPKSA